MDRWTPILTPGSEVAARAWEAVDGISQALLERAGRPAPIFEEALLYGYLALARNEEVWMDRATGRLNEAIDYAAVQAGHPRLAAGLCRLGWCVEQLSALLGEESGDLNAEIDQLVLRRLRSAGRWQGPYDLIGGLVGFGAYFLERLPGEAAEEGLELIVRHLEALSEPAADGITWHSGPELLTEWQRRRCPDGFYNLGVAHGVPGIIHLLSEVAAAEIGAQRVKKLLEGGMKWLLANQRPRGAVSRFGPWLAAGESSDSRLTWCYGDLGILAVLLQVGRRSGRGDWQGFAHDLLDHCLAWPREKTGIEDAPLCHGAAGAAHIFNRIYQAEGDARCREAALYWCERTLAMRRPDEGVGGFFKLAVQEPGAAAIWEAAPDFLDGATGVALALVAALTPISPAWDRMLLISGRRWGDDGDNQISDNQKG